VKEITILFDLDGTLIDSTEAILESFAEAFKQMGMKQPDDEAIKKLIGYPLDVMFVELGVPEVQKWDYVDAYKRHYRKISKEKTVLLPYAREAIELAYRHARLGIVTTKTALYSREMLEHMGVMRYFDTLVGREDVTHPKPHPEPIETALARMGCGKEKCWMIGDTPMDIEAAQRAGIACAALSCGYASIDELSAYGVKIFPDAHKAVKFITAS